MAFFMLPSLGCVPTDYRSLSVTIDFSTFMCVNPSRKDFPRY